MSTIFTSIIEGQIPGRFVWADEHCVVFATIAPISDGHMLVVPREEVERFTDADDALVAHLMMVAKRIGSALEESFDAPRAAILVAGFEVPHLHIHVLPAWGESSLSFEHADPDVPPGRLDAATEKLREALRRAGHGSQVPREMGSPAL
ncbi:HIT family protein [Bogoriella caseilytica]|nr:HIT family protein [Bogoriella caseilytica]